MNYDSISLFLKSIEHDFIFKLISTIGIILLLWLVRLVLHRVLRRKLSNPKLKYQWLKYTSYIIVTIGVFVVVNVWFVQFSSVSTFLGLVSAGIAIALKDPIVNLAGWVFILWRHPFKVGDRIQIGNNFGDVIDQRIFQFTIMEIGNWVDAEQYTGRMVHIPNGKVFTDVQANYNYGFNFIWNEIPVLLTFESDWQTAKNLLSSIAIKHGKDIKIKVKEEINNASNRFMIYLPESEPIVYTSVQDSGVLLTIRYPCALRTRRQTEESIWEEILIEFAKCNNIDFAYPTTRFYNNLNEGK